jgi:pSer/pThr/pTyr-binding forkhead associated (FHA) protein
MLTMGVGGSSVFELNRPVVTIGRDLSNDLVIQDPEVSRFHARLTRQAGGYVLEDLHSTNGTSVNGDPIDAARLMQPNDLLKLGSMVQLQFIQREPASVEPADVPKRPPGDVVLAKDDTLTNLLSDAGRTQPRKLSKLGTGVEPGSLASHVFIAYAREEWESVVAPIMLGLEDAGLRVWVDQYLIQGSEDWRVAVEQALAECWLMVVVLSPTALTSNYLKLQYRFFYQLKKPIIPLICESASLPNELGRLRALTHEKDNPPRSVHKLVYEIMQLRD